MRTRGQHRRHIDRRSALLRVSMHISELQLKREGVATSFDQILAENIFAGSAVLTDETGATSYQSLLGCQPRMLPPLEMPGWCEGEPRDGREEATVREVCLSPAKSRRPRSQEQPEQCSRIARSPNCENHFRKLACLAHASMSNQDGNVRLAT